MSRIETLAVSLFPAVAAPAVARDADGAFAALLRKEDQAIERTVPERSTAERPVQEATAAETPAATPESTSDASQPDAARADAAQREATPSSPQPPAAPQEPAVAQESAVVPEPAVVPASEHAALPEAVTDLSPGEAPAVLPEVLFPPVAAAEGETESTAADRADASMMGLVPAALPPVPQPLTPPIAVASALLPDAPGDAAGEALTALPMPAASEAAAAMPLPAPLALTPAPDAGVQQQAPASVPPVALAGQRPEKTTPAQTHKATAQAEEHPAAAARLPQETGVDSALVAEAADSATLADEPVVAALVADALPAADAETETETDTGNAAPAVHLKPAVSQDAPVVAQPLAAPLLPQQALTTAEALPQDAAVAAPAVATGTETEARAPSRRDETASPSPAAGADTTAQAAKSAAAPAAPFTQAQPAAAPAAAAGLPSFEQVMQQTQAPTGSAASHVPGGKADGTPAGQTGFSGLPFAAPVTEQISLHVRKALEEGNNRIRIKMQPASLGQVEVRMEVGHDGSLKAVLAADKHETFEWLQRDARSLERALQESGFKTDSGSLSFQYRGGGDGQQRSFADQQAQRLWAANDRNVLDATVSITTEAPLRQSVATGRIDLKV